MSESLSDLLRRLSTVLHFFRMYEESKVLGHLAMWLDKHDIRSDDDIYGTHERRLKT